MKEKSLISVLASLGIVLALLRPVAAGPEVHVYSHRHYQTDQELFDTFQQETGIEVKVVKANADQLIQRLELEGADSPADLLITADAGRLYRAKDKGLLQAVGSGVLSKAIPAALRDDEGYWFGLTRRARVIVYARDRVQPEELSTYEDLADPKWRGRVLVRSSQNIYNQSLLASLIAALGHDPAAAWAAGVVQNFARRPKGNDRDQVKAIAAGVGDVALVNTYYIGKLLDSKDAAEREVGGKVGVFFPNQPTDGRPGRGAHINISGAGVTAHAKNKAHAVRLLEFLVSVEAQKRFAEANYEYPVRPDVEPSALVRSWGDFSPESIDLELLGRNNAAAVRLFAAAGWR